MQVERENPETTKHVSIINTIQNKKKVFVCLFVYAVLFSMRIVDVSGARDATTRPFKATRNPVDFLGLLCR